MQDEQRNERNTNPVQKLYRKAQKQLKRLTTNGTFGRLWADMRIRILMIVGAALILFVLFSFAVMRSVPGSILYPLKTDVVEEFMSASHLSSEARARYRLTLLEHRLDELQRMGERDSVSEGALETLRSKSEAHWSDIRLIIEQGADIELSTTLDIMLDASAVLRAQEQTAEESDVLDSVENGLEDMRRDAEDIYEDLVLLFVVQSDEAGVETYVDAQLSTLGTMVAERELEEETIDRIGLYISRVQTAIVEDDAVRAIEEAGNALRLIRSIEYLRG